MVAAFYIICLIVALCVYRPYFHVTKSLVEMLDEKPITYTKDIRTHEIFQQRSSVRAAFNTIKRGDNTWLN